MSSTKRKTSKRPKHTKRRNHMIKIRIVIGTVAGGQYVVPEVGSSIPMTVEKAIDAAWESVLGQDLAGSGVELHIVDVELPMPVAPDPTEREAKRVAKAVRVNSNDAIHRGRKQALEHVIKNCALDDEAIKRIKRVDVDMDFRKEDYA